MAAAGPSTNRSGRPRKPSTVASHPPLPHTPTVETPTPSAMGAVMMSMPAPSYASNGPITIADCESSAAILLDPTIAMRRRLEVASELRDSAETPREFNFYDKYLAIFIPALVTLLGDEKAITFLKDTTDQRFRHTLFSYLQRLPHTEPFKQHETTVMELMVKLLKVENEENALMCIKVIIDGFRSHKEQAEPIVEPFLELVKQMYANTKLVIEKEFGPFNSTKPPSTGPSMTAPSPAPATPAGSDGSTLQGPPQASSSAHSLLARALHSPKVLTDCPIAVVLIFQTYKSVMAPTLLEFYPLVMESIKIQPEPQRLAQAEAKERGEILVGISSGITNTEMYADLIKSQVKTMAFLAYVLRQSQNTKDYLEVFPEAVTRLLQDCPSDDVGTRKELLVATRHILTAESRAAFIPYIDVLLEEKVLVGTGVTSREALRPLAYSVVADLIHHVRNELPPQQLARVVYVFSLNLNDATFSSSIQTMCAKLLNTIIESIHNRVDGPEATKITRSMFFSSLEKLVAMTEAFDRLKVLNGREKSKGKAKAKEVEADGDVSMDDAEAGALLERQIFGWRDIEVAMPVHSVSYANEAIDLFCREARYLFKTLLHTFRSILTITRQPGNPQPQPDGELLGKFFEYSLRALAIFEGNRDPREPKEAIELLSQILLLMEPHVFSQIWAKQLDSFVEQSMVNLHVFPVLQMLITHETVSHQLVAILLKYLMTHLAGLGSLPKHRAALILRLFKMSFLAINTYIITNELVLVPHLQKLILSSFSFAAKAEDPAIYYQILRALFRSIGGGRFEALYKEVLPILQEMLDTLAYLLQHAADDAQRDLFVELTLTVPVRLTNLLPHLSYLMQPLVHALQAGSDLISQGLRTLELCIDNLTADFLDPTMRPVLRDLMGALHQLLKPIPANRSHANAAIKILGKLGGRNRRFLEVDKQLDFRVPGWDLATSISFEGRSHRMSLAFPVQTAGMTIATEALASQEDGLQVLILTALTVFQDDAPNPETNATFLEAMGSLFLATGRKGIADRAVEFIRDFCKRTFALELVNSPLATTESKYHPDLGRKRFLNLTTALSDCFVQTLAESRAADRSALCRLLAVILLDLRTMSATPEFSSQPETTKNVDRLIQSFSHRAIQLCHEEDWSRKMAGIAAMNVLVKQIDLPRRMIIELEIDFVRALLYVLRDAPKDAPSTASDAVHLIKYLIQICQSHEEGRMRLQRLTETLVLELVSQSEVSRQAAKDSIGALADVVGLPIPDLIGAAAKSKLMDMAAGPLFSKPLRALPFPMEIGSIDAVTYLMDLRPTFIHASDEFLRLLHEVLALADVDDNNLISKPSTHKQEQWLKSLRIACLRFLRSSVAMPDFLNQPNMVPVRSRIIQVYFKHVYSANPEVVDIAYDGLREVLNQQAKLPKEVLQSGLRPILVNLADARRLSVSGLDGLARFLELLTTYFKVEIGVKLLDHFNTMGDHQMLVKAAYSPLDDNQDIQRMTRLVNIFRLLPPGAVQYMNRLTAQVVDVEALLHQSSPGPFTETLGRYLDRYHVEGSQVVMDNMRNPRYILTFRNIIASGHAPQFVEVLSSRANEIGQMCFANPDALDYVVPGLFLIRELSRTSPSWLSDHGSVFESVVDVWRSILIKSRNLKFDMSSSHYQQMSTLILEMFTSALQYDQHIPLLFHVVETFEIRSSFEKSNISFFLYQQAALQDSVQYRREVVEHFFNLYEDESVTWAFKTNALRLIVNPTLRVYFSDPDQDGSLVTSELIEKIGVLMWRPLAVPPAARQREDTLLIEIFAMTTMLVQHLSEKVGIAKKDVFKLGWIGINLLEPTVKLMAYVLTVRFMATYETPHKFVRLTWVGLLRLKDYESRTLYRQALDILASCIVLRDPPPPLPAIPEWALRVRGALIDEGHATGQLVTVCELLVNHPDIFYDYRDLYVPHIANSLSKLAFVNAATQELRKLTVDIVELIFNWEKRRMAARDGEAMDIDVEGAKRSAESSAETSPMKRQRVDRIGTAISSTSGAGWAAPSQVRELMTAHLLRLVSVSTDPVGRGGLTKRALDLFKEILSPRGLPNVSVKLVFFLKTMTSDITESNINTMANSTEVIAATAAVRDQQWVRSNLGLLTKLLEKVWLFDDTGLHDTVEDLTLDMFKEMPDNEIVAGVDPDAKALLVFVQSAVADGLTASLKSSAHLPGALYLLRLWLKAQPNQQIHAETIGAGILKVLANLVKVHTTPPPPDKEHPINGPDPAYRLIISVLDIIRDRVGDLKDQRRHLIGVLGSLVDRSGSVMLCKYLLDMIRQWTIEDPDPLLGKERANLLLKMAAFEQRDQSLFERYLDVIYDIYELDALRGTDITHRLESAFLLGTRSTNASQRTRFLDKLEQSLPRSLDGRLQYLFSLQNWETLSDSYWIPQILSMLLGVLDHQDPLIRSPLAVVLEEDAIIAMSQRSTVGDLVRALRNLIHVDTKLAHRLWATVFPFTWSALSRGQQTAFTGYILKLLSREYHCKQVEYRPNVIQTFLDGLLPCAPAVTLPPLLIKYLAKTFNVWYTGFELLTRLSDVYRPDDALRESCAGALSELYAELSEDDMYYGLARSRCVFVETNAGLSYEQNGQWPKAIEQYEIAQFKARNGLLPFSEEEYCLWEDHWILASQKLQNWESLTELAKVDQDHDLLLECAWRLIDWGTNDREAIEPSLARIVDVATPRRKTFEAWYALLRSHLAREAPNDFTRILDEAQQVTLRKWISLPSHITHAHLPLLQTFQQCVELTEASQVLDSLSMTNGSNLEMRVYTDLKQIFQTWRDRLPNFWDDIMVWSDLLAWRQHVFQSVTRVYVPLIPPGETGTYGYRGYHETAWMINRFGEVARRHGLLDVCSVSLNKIYALPNIEISEAFLKLREQALCFFQKPEKFNDGLENISTTNLMYFAPNQKSEFLTLKGMFIARLGQNEEANTEFAHAITMDMNLPKAWAEWGRFNDKLYRDRPEEPLGPAPDPKTGEARMSDELWRLSYSRDRAVLASSAVSCYLQAAGLYSNHKSRGLLLRVLWLLGLDDTNNTISRAFEAYKGEHVVWYWITLIPQLLLSLSHREAKQAKTILMRIAKAYPQALFYHLRVSREDFGNVKRQQLNARAQAARRAAEAAKINDTQHNGDTSATDADKNDDRVKEVQSQANGGTHYGSADGSSMPPPSTTLPRQPWELVDEIMNALKTGFPLLALTMEKMVDQISLRAKPSSDEDIYRFFAALLADALQWGGRSSVPNDDGELNQTTKENLTKFSNNLSGDLKAAIEKDFMKDMPKLREYIKRLQWWRDTYERSLDSRSKNQPLDQGGCNLIEFHHTKFDDVEIPGQYVQHVDPTQELIKIARFSPKAELGRGHGHCFRRITMIGSDGVSYTFTVQMPAARHCRREERLTQLFRIMNSVLQKRKESRKRNLQFHLPTAIALAPQLRLVQNDISYVSLQDIFDDYCSSHGMSREDSIMAFLDRMKQLHDPVIPKTDARYLHMKAEVAEELQVKMIPENILTNYMIKTMQTPDSLWLMRKQFAMQTATVMFLTYVCCLSNRTPSRFHLSRRSGQMYMTEILPAFASGQPIIASGEAVPFRLTPNMQNFITRTGIEGVVTSAVTAISRSLTTPEFDLAGTLSLFIRDEILTWHNTYMKEPKTNESLAAQVYKNVDNFIRRASTMGYLGETRDKETGSTTFVHAIVTLISQATSPNHLAQMSESFMAWY